jgi:hypothetical protein
MIQALALAGAQLACLNFIQYEITIEQFNGNALYSAGTRKSILTTRIQSLSFELKRLMRSWRLLPDFVNTRVLSERRQHDGYHQRLRLSPNGANCTQETTQTSLAGQPKREFDEFGHFRRHVALVNLVEIPGQLPLLRRLLRFVHNLQNGLHVQPFGITRVEILDAFHASNEHRHVVLGYIDAQRIGRTLPIG